MESNLNLLSNHRKKKQQQQQPPQQQQFIMTRGRNNSSNNTPSRHSFSTRDRPSIFSPLLSHSLARKSVTKTMSTKENDSYSSPRPSFCADTACRKPSPRRFTSSWALSPGRSLDIDIKTETMVTRRKSVDYGRMSAGSVGGVMSLFIKRKKLNPEEEEIAHKLKILMVRLIQWRFINARSISAMDRRKFVSERKLFYAWLRMSEMRNVVATKWVLLQRGRLKLKLVHILVPQVQMLIKWEQLLARQHLEALAVLGKVLGTICLSLPLVKGAQANIVSIHKCMRVSMDIMKDIEAKAKFFYAKAESISLMLGELTKTIQLEIEALQEVTKLSRKINLLEMEEISLRSNLIQATKADDENIALSKPLALHRYITFQLMPAALKIDF